MQDIRIADNLWASNMLPEGLFERWRVAEGASVGRGEVVAEIRVEDALHEVVAPTAGRLLQLTGPGAIIEPGSLIARLDLPMNQPH